MDVSVVRMSVALALLVPAVVLAAVPAVDELPVSRLPQWVTLVERTGQVAVLALLVMSGAELRRTGLVSLVLAAIAMLSHLLWFVAHFLASDRRACRLYEPAGPLLLPLAVLPVVALLALAVGAWSVPLAGALVVFAPAHIAISADAWAQLRANPVTE